MSFQERTLVSDSSESLQSNPQECFHIAVLHQQAVEKKYLFLIKMWKKNHWLVLQLLMLNFKHSFCAVTLCPHSKHLCYVGKAQCRILATSLPPAMMCGGKVGASVCVCVCVCACVCMWKDTGSKTEKTSVGGLRCGDWQLSGFSIWCWNRAFVMERKVSYFF